MSDLKVLHDALLSLKADQINNRIDYMDYSKYPEQNELIESMIKRLETKEGPSIYVIFGSNRGGKSETGGIIVSELFKRMKNKRMWAATYSDMTIKVQQRKCADLIRKKDIEYGDFNLVRGWSNNVIISKNKSAIYFKSYEQGHSSFQGDDVDLIWLDEEPEFPIFEECLVRLTDRQGILLMTFTALQGFTRLVNRFWESSDPNHFVRVLTVDKNPYLKDAAKKQMFNMLDEDERETRYYGKPRILEGLIYKDYDASHKIDRFDYVELVKKYPERFFISEGIDPHERTPHHWNRFLFDNDNDILYVVEEIAAPYESMLIRDFSLLIKNSRKQITSKSVKIEYCQIDTASMKPDVINVHPDEDQTNVHTVRREFQRNGVETILCMKDNAIGIGQVKARLKTVKTASGKVKRKPTIYFFNDLHGTNEQMSKYVWEGYATEKSKERKEQLNRPKKKNDHYCDIVKYECLKRLIKKPVEEFYQEPDDLYDGIGY